MVFVPRVPRGIGAVGAGLGGEGLPPQCGQRRSLPFSGGHDPVRLEASSESRTLSPPGIRSMETRVSHWEYQLTRCTPCRPHTLKVH